MRTTMLAGGAVAAVLLGVVAWSALDDGTSDGAESRLPAAEALATAPARSVPTPTPTREATPTLSQPAESWVADTAAGSGIPAAAVRAYGRATLNAPDGCGLGWATLAGIGWVETHHGTIDGRTLGADGRPSAEILGPALDGQGDVAAIGASRSGTALHGNDRWEHAVGPMQFIPSSWERWGVDGDEDGTADPHDLDDAALAAARYLCEGGGDLSTVDGWSAAVLSYNKSTEYVHQVNVAAIEYASR
ncbi:MAG: lytic murein transglycosylase [Nocardioides sp.]|uniref:lytic murein transglycosylase n=1 Tax=Nocardioides sp. TaxID=35761 RepID=UPI003F087E93